MTRDDVAKLVAQDVKAILKKHNDTIMENNTKGAGDDYPIIPQPEGSESKMEQVAYEIAMKIVNVPDNKPEHTANHKLHSIHSIVMNTMRTVEREKEKELASMKEVVRELIPIAERMKSACESGETLCFDNEYDLRDATEYQKVIDRAKRISDNK